MKEVERGCVSGKIGNDSVMGIADGTEPLPFHFLYNKLQT